MAGNSESIKKDTNKRKLGDIIYLDNEWINDYVLQSANFSTGSTSRTDVTGMSVTKYCERDMKVLILFTARLQIEHLSYAIVNLDIDGVTQYPELYGATIEIWMTRTGHTISELAAGSHVFKLQLRSSVLGQAVQINSNSILNVIEIHK